MLDTTKSSAPSAAAHYLREAISAIDEEFGEGYAAEHPELIGMLVQASAIESAVNAGRIASRETCETLLKLKPRLFG
ncbi:MAG: hypothetical protein AAFQ51_08505 [Pseudomonadota bacterium]